MSTNPPSRPISHQTIRLARGRHATPADGACVMELASMLAGERFTDHPRAVCRVIAAFLRSYNDSIDDVRRQDLLRCAAEVVGTRDSRPTERARLARCERELAELHGCRSATWRRVAATAWPMLPLSPYAVTLLGELAHALSVTESGHRRALRLVADLVDIRVAPAPPCRVMSGRPDPAAARGVRRGSGAARSTV
jgi:hypothetical protein